MERPALIVGRLDMVILVVIDDIGSGMGALCTAASWVYTGLG